MNQKLRFFMLALLCAVLNVEWGESKTGNITFGPAEGSTTINAASVTGNDNLDNEWIITTVGTTSFTNNNGQAFSQVGSSSKPATSITFTTTLPKEQTIKSFSAKFGGFNSTAGTVTLKVGDTTVGTGSLNSANDVTVSSTSVEKGTVLTVTVAGISKGVKCYNISYSYEESGEAPTVSTPTITPNGGTYISAQSVTISCGTAGATIYYTTDGSDPTTNSAVYSEAIPVSTTTTIKAMAVKSGMTNSNVASAVYTIKPLEHAGTQADPYSVADARNAIDANMGIEDVYATGIVSNIVTEYSDQYENITYDISVDGSTTSDQLRVYRCKNSNEENSPKVKVIKVGDKVVVSGNLIKYNSSIYEFSEGNTLVSLQTSAAAPTFEPAEGTFTSAQNVTISCETDGASIYYTTNGDDPTIESSVYSNPISVTVSGTTIKAIAVKEGYLNSVVSKANYIIKPDSPTITQEGNTVTMTAAEGCTIYFNKGTNNSDTDAPTNASTEYTGPIEMTENAYFKAIAYDQYDNASDIKNFDFKYSSVVPHPKNINSNYFVKVTEASKLEDGDAILIVAENGGSYYAMGGQNSNNRSAVSVSVNDNAIKITNDNESVQKIVFVDASNENKYGYFYVGKNGYLYAASSSSNNLKTEKVADDNAKAEISISNNVTTIIFQGSNTRNEMRFNPNASNDNPLFACYASTSTTGSPVQIYKEVPKPTITATFNPKYKGFTSIYYSDKNLKVPANVTAHTYKVVGGKGEYIKNIAAEGVIPAGTPVILEYGGTFANDTDPVEVTFEEVTSAEPLNDGNMLRGSDQVDAEGYTTVPDGENIEDYYFYVLSVGSEGNEVNKIGFYKKNADGSKFKPTAHKVYLALKKSEVDANAFMVSISDTNGINSISANNDSTEAVYSLSGIRMNGKDLPKGIYIIGGKKVVIK